MTEKEEDPYDVPDSEFPEKAEEGCYVDKNGVVSDEAFHAEFLNNPEAEKAFQSMVFDQAIKDGMDPAVATQLYGNVRPTQEETDITDKSNGPAVTVDQEAATMPKAPQAVPKRDPKNYALPAGLAETAYLRAGAAYRTRTCDPIITNDQVVLKGQVKTQLCSNRTCYSTSPRG